MDIHTDVREWLQQMGYCGQIPDDLIRICNKSTRNLWHQLVLNVRPKQEAEKIKRNIILIRIKAKPLTRQNEFPYKLTEIANVQRKQRSEENLSRLKNVIQERRREAEQLQKILKIKRFTLSSVKNDTKENEKRRFLLDAKKKLLEKQLSDNGQVIEELKVVTPVEHSTSITKEEINETLDKCAKKLQDLISDNQKYSTCKNSLKSFTNRARKRNQNLNHSTFATCLSILEEEENSVYELTMSSRGKKNKAENSIYTSHTKVKHRLFQSAEINVSCTDSVSVPDKTPPSNKRESLGLLPESFLSEVDGDLFLLPNDTQNSIGLRVLDNSICSTFAEAEQLFSTTIIEKNPQKSEDIKKLYGHKLVNAHLKSVLKKSSRELLANLLSNYFKEVKIQLYNIFDDNESSLPIKNDKINIGKLQFAHVEIEFKNRRQKDIIKKLTKQIADRTSELVSTFTSHPNSLKLKEQLEAVVKQVAFDASLQALKLELNNQKLPFDDSKLKSLARQATKVSNSIETNKQCIQLTVNHINDIYKDILDTRSQIDDILWKINVFRMNDSWRNQLSRNAWTEELCVFADFPPFEFQQRCFHKDSTEFERDCPFNGLRIAHNPQTAEDNLLCEILENPLQPPEVMLLKFLRAKSKLNVLKAIHSERLVRQMTLNYQPKYSLKELLEQESYINYALDRLMALKDSPKANKTFALENVIRQMVAIWTEMPISEFISKERLFDGKNFTFYQNKLKRLL